ncbi:MAG: GNAT family N-acyltransferase [Pseudomonadota bacterium]
MSEAQATVLQPELDDILAYLTTVAISLPKAVTEPENLQPIADQTPVATLKAEISGLAPQNLLYEYKQYRVYGGTAQEMPHTLKEITRLRELTFRAMQEGSGLAVDTDRHDQSYIHLFVWDTQEDKIVGGYRLGKTDELLASYGSEGVYLADMFEFDPSFYEISPTLEIGRSFVVPEYQRNHHSLSLLWCGIGQYIVRNPRYRRVYGVVSMSRIYDATTIAAIRDALVEPADDVRPKAPYEPDLGKPWQDFVGDHGPLGMKIVSHLVKALEENERDVPVLIRHYHKLGARFVSAAVDASFNNTPGLLLCLDVPNIPQKYLKQYLREGAQAYVNYGAS